MARSSSAPPVWLIYASVFAGGMLGGSTRYLIGLLAPTQPGAVPWGILAINVLGAFILGLLLAGWVRRGHVAHPWRPFLATGILGSFTTWSAFMTDTHALYQGQDALLATAYLVGATALGIAAAGLGWWVAQRIVPSAEQVPA